MKIDTIIAQMSLEDKIDLCTGADFWNTKNMEKYGITSFKMADGPHGLRAQEDNCDMIGINDSIPATCFPSAVTSCATWNEELIAKEGEAIGQEALNAQVHVVLGPGCNIKRNPLCGRNFEYFSEDPYLSGKMAASYIKGQQSTGVMSSLKHFALNNQETKRFNGDSLVDERAMREIYLAPFEIAVKEGKPATVMCAYNKINGIHCSDHHWLLTDVLRDEWGFDGMVVTDWGAMNDRIESFKAGCDLNMPGGSQFMKKATIKAIKDGLLDEKMIDASVRRILSVMEKAQSQKKEHFDVEKNHQLALQIAHEGAVLLKNENHLLPLSTNDMILIGHMAKDFRYQGTGSSHIHPTRLISLCDAFPHADYFECCDADGNVTDEKLSELALKVQQVKVPIVVVGLPESYESEALDRESMKLPKGHQQMIEVAAKHNPNTVVVLLGGSVMEVDWIDQIKAVLYMGLSGQAGGQAIADILTGKIVPSGKLTESWPMKYEDVISKDTFGKRNTEYRESIYVGYRYYDSAQQQVRFPFGYGLSYTSFDYSHLQVNHDEVIVTITNTGSLRGAEVVQLYIAAPQNGIHCPIRELKGFKKVVLNPNESQTISFKLEKRSFAIWKDGWKVPQGTYVIEIGANSRDIRLRKELEIEGDTIEKPSWQNQSWYETLRKNPTREEWEKVMGYHVPLSNEPQKGFFTMDNTCMEMKDSSFIMKIQYKITENIIAKSYGGKKDYSNPSFRMTLLCALDCPMRAVIINSNGTMKDAIAHGLIEMANGHYLRGIGRMMKGD
ncbi:MAG: glycoside hydrolase family 3 C-terminal domain-containing protein [Traorella sp.]